MLPGFAIDRMVSIRVNQLPGTNVRQSRERAKLLFFSLEGFYEYDIYENGLAP